MGKVVTGGGLYRHIRLSDGRRLGYLDCGDPTGKPLFYFHCFRLSRFGKLPHQVAKRLGVRLIAPDRPGFGLSDFKPGRTIQDWANDVAELADALQIQRFYVLGHSGGGPYAAACAHELPERVIRAALISSIGFEVPDEASQVISQIPLSYYIGRIALAWIARAYLQLSGRLGVMPRGLALAATSGMSLFSMPARMTLLTQFVTGLGDETTRAQRYGAAWELVLYTRPWGFRLQDIAVEVQLWHGEADRACPISLMRYIAQRIPKCQARFFPAEDHFSVFSKHTPEILAGLFEELNSGSVQT